MKRIALILTLLVLAFGSTARAAVSTTNFVALRAEIVSQLTTASNAVPVNKKLIASLKKSLAVIDKPGVASLVNDTKVLTLLTPLSKSVLSNQFNPLLSHSLNDYLALFYASAASGSNALGATFPSGVHTSAEKKLVVLYNQLVNADNLADLIAAAKQLAAAAKTYGVVNALVVKAQAVPPPPSSMSAKITGAVSHTITDKPRFSNVSGSHPQPGNFTVNLVMGTISPIGQRILTLAFYNLVEGNNTRTCQNDDFQGFYGYLQAPATAGNFTADDSHGSGTLNVNLNSAAGTVSGTFTFTGVDGIHSANVTGQFVYHY